MVSGFGKWRNIQNVAFGNPKVVSLSVKPKVLIFNSDINEFVEYVKFHYSQIKNIRKGHAKVISYIPSIVFTENFELVF